MTVAISTNGCFRFAYPSMNEGDAHLDVNTWISIFRTEITAAEREHRRELYGVNRTELMYQQLLSDTYKKLQTCRDEMKTLREQTEQDKDCIRNCNICLVNSKRIAVFPCGHLSMCKACYDQLETYRCPDCKENITGSSIVYMPS